MQAPARLEGDALPDGKCAAILAAGQRQLLTFDERTDEEHEVLELGGLGSGETGP